MKITAQEKIAELERRIVALESALGDPRWRTIAEEVRAARSTTTTTTTGPLTPTQQTHLDRMWGKFGEMFDEFGKVFRS